MPGFMDILQQLLGGNQQGLGALGGQQGMMQPQQGMMAQQQSNPLRDLSLGLLKANQPSPYKKGWSGLLGEAVLNADEMGQKRQQDQLQQLMLQAKLRQSMQPDLPQGYRMNPQTGQAELVPGVDPSFGKKSDPFASLIAGAYGPQKPPTGYQYSPDGNLTAIPGGPDDPNSPKRFTPEQAGKVSMNQNALDAVKKARDMMLGEDGKVDTKKLLSAQMNLPNTEGRQIRNLMKNAIEAQLRLESGAAVPETEVERALDRFLPSVLDSEPTKLQKFQQLENLLSGGLGAMGVAPNQPATASKPVNLTKTVGGKTYIQVNGEWYEQ
jgi:hypothetical protein